jgi:hypothetical protein
VPGLLTDLAIHNQIREGHVMYIVRTINIFFQRIIFILFFFWQFLIIIRFNNCTVIITRMEVLLLLLLFSFERGRNTNDLFEFLMDDVRGPAYKVH